MSLPLRAMAGLALAAVAVASAPATAQTAFADPAELDMRVAIFAGAMIGAEGGARTPVDRRLKLARCGGNPELAWRTARQDAVVVACTGPQPWTIYVPVKRSQAITAKPETVAAARPSAPSAPVRPAPAAAGPAVIKRGDPVSLTAESGGFSVTREGVAMDDAAAGGRLKVKVDGTRVPVQGIAVASGNVLLASWQ